MDEGDDNIMSIREVRASGETADANVFADQVPRLDELNTKVSDTMRGFAGLAIQFSSIMQERLMPADVAIVGEDKVTENERGWVMTGKRLPLWVVISDTNLSGKSMFRGTVGTETYSRSLLSGTPNNFRTNYKSYNDEDAFKKARDTGRDIVSVQALKHAIGLTAAGEYVLLEKESSHRRGDPRMFWLPSEFTVNGDPKPSDFFDVDTKDSPKSLVTKMQKRMNKAIDIYNEKMHKEMSELSEGEAIARSLGYYKPREGEIIRYERPVAKDRQKRRFFGIF